MNVRLALTGTTVGLNLRKDQDAVASARSGERKLAPVTSFACI